MLNRIQFELASPKQLLVNKSVVMAMVPGTEGLFGVLAGHAPMMSAVGAGVVDVYENDDQGEPSESYFVAGGFAEVEEGGRCAVLAEQVIPLVDLKRTDVEKEIAVLEEKLSGIDMMDDREPVEAELAIVRKKLEVAHV